MSTAPHRRMGHLTIGELAEYLAIKMEDHLAKMSPAERKAHLAKFRKKTVALRAKRARRVPARTSAASTRTR